MIMNSYNPSILGKAIMKYSPLALTIVGAGGVIFTAVASAKATPKALVILKEEEEKKQEALTFKEKFKVTWKCYIPTGLIVLGTILCIFGANVLNQKQQASLASAYVLLSRKYKDYISKVKELYGEETHEKVVQELTVETPKDVSISTAGFCGLSTISIDFEDADEETHLFYDSFSKRYFESTFSKVLMAEYYLNRNFSLGWIPSVNDFYDFLGLEHTDYGSSVGWTNSDGEYYWIDFNHYKVTMDDGLVCYVIESDIPPTSEFLKDL